MKCATVCQGGTGVWAGDIVTFWSLFRFEDVASFLAIIPACGARGPGSVAGRDLATGLNFRVKYVGGRLHREGNARTTARRHRDRVIEFALRKG
jgi:hypothetical protein